MDKNFWLALSMIVASMTLSQAVAQDRVILEEIEVIGISPVLGVSLPQDRIATTTYVIDGAVLQQSHSRDLAEALQNSVAAIITVDVQNSPHQRDLNYRGYTVSPLLGLPQGLAVYQNGVRINEPFGDVVQWDGLPEFAIDNAQVIAGANPVFGLNALGGSIALQMKNGFDHQGVNFEVIGGRFGRFESTLEGGFATEDKNWAFYGGAKHAFEKGFRPFSKSNFSQFYGDGRYRETDMEASLDVTFADSHLRGNGPTPVDLIFREGIRSVFTHPDRTQNQLVALNSALIYDVNDAISLQSQVYYRYRKRDTVNGDEAELEECAVAGEDYISAEEGADCGEERYIDGKGNFIKVGDFALSLGKVGNSFEIDDEIGGAYNRSETISHSGGTNVQLSHEARLGTLDHLVTGGLSFDFGSVNYHSSSELGILDDGRGVQLSGITLGGESPVGLRSRNTHVGIYLMELLTPLPKFDVTVAGRWNWSRVTLSDLRGGDLTGRHVFQRFNPSLGVVWRPLKAAQFFASYSEANRVPTAAELGCADPDNACRLPNAFLADPPLKQVKNRSFELGMRGNQKIKDVKLQWSGAYFHGVNRDDILFVAGNRLGTGYFSNVGRTKRQGVELALSGKWNNLSWRLSYALVHATFRGNFEVSSPSHPHADSNQKISVEKNDRLPSIPLHSGVISVDYDVTPPWQVGIDLIIRDGQYHRGDESNQLDKIKGYVTLSLHSHYRIKESVVAFFRMDNLFNQKYETFGLLGDGTEVLDYATNPRFVSATQPFGFHGGLRFSY